MPTIQERHQKQLAKIQRALQLRGWEKALQALTFAKDLEAGQLRKDGETPSFHHQLSVARYVYTLTPHLLRPEDCVAAAFLHDVLEDHGEQFSIDDMAGMFGPLHVDIVKLSKKYRGRRRTTTPTSPTWPLLLLPRS